ncbi:8326_t:CDS:2, partial [Gigaspora margarita]
MDFDLDPNVEENYNLKTGVTEDDLSKNQDLQEVACFTKKLHVNQIIYTALPIEYPAISEDGIATIYNVNGWDNYMDAFNNVDYYRTPYIISSLNYHCSKIDHITWTQAGNNTNAAEAAHAYANRSGKQLKLLSAINQGRKLDETTVSRMQMHIKFNVLVTQRDNGEIKRKVAAMTHKSAVTSHK